MRFSLVLWLAWRDWAGEWRTSLCLAIGVAAAVAPLLMLFAVRSGVIAGMREELQRDPSSRELQTRGQPVVTWVLTEDLARRPDVGFVKPTTRLLSASGVLRRPDDPLGGVVVDLIPSGPGDPVAVLAGVRRWTPECISITDAVARGLHVKRDDKLSLVIDRTAVSGQPQAQILRFCIAGVVPAWLGNREAAMIDSDLLGAIEIYRENVASESFASALRMAQSSRTSRTYSGLRLYARDIDAVDGLRAFLLGRGIETEGRLDEIHLIQRLDAALTILFVILAGVVSTGLCFALAAAQWAWVDRKRRDLSFLRLIGLESGFLALIPMIQSVLTAICGLALASLLSWAGGALINSLLADQLSGVKHISRAQPEHFLIALLLAAVAGLFASFAAASSARRIAPATVLREA
jgi:putative ABC transport system permease protein